MTARSSEERLLSILHAHGQQFLSAFDVPALNREARDSDGSNPDSEEEWTGFSSSVDKSISDVASGDFEQEDDEFVGSSSRKPDFMVFLDSTHKRQEASLSTKESRKSFMSFKVPNITSSHTQPISKGKTPAAELDGERTNAQNDALLHRLVHTKLLSGSLNPQLELDHAQKGRALAGRVLELTGEAKLGKGESMFRRDLCNKAAKRIRDGLIRKQREKEQRALEEAKNLGNYHPTLKRLYDSKPSTRHRKRARGLEIGVGRFVGGTLKLSRDEIASVTESGKPPHGDVRQRMRRRSR